MLPTLIILHGWGETSSDWLMFKQMIEKDFSTICFDLPGFGNEPLKNSDWTVPDYASWVVQRLESVQGPKIILGHSFGGRIGSYIASNKPAWLKGLILDGAPCIYRPNLKVKTKIFLAKISKMLNLKKFFIVKNNELINADNKGLGKISRNAVSFDQTKILPKINVPTLIIWGEYDSIVPIRIAKEMQTLIPKSKLSVIDKVGHHTHQENPYLFYGIIKHFIKNL